MTIYKNGSRGDDVRRIQQALKEAGHLTDAPDGIFGSRTEAAVKAFQNKAGLTADGLVGPATWGKLFPLQTPEQPAISGDVDARCLGLTGSFETSRPAPGCFSAVTGNFDGQGMSFGALQWNFGQETLQPLLKQMLTDHHDVAAAIFGEHLDTLQQAISSDKATALDFASSIQDPTGKKVTPLWKDMFEKLGGTPEFRAIEVSGATSYAARAATLCREYDLWSERGHALMFDICVQNGSIPARVREQIQTDFAGLSAELSPEEIEVEKCASWPTAAPKPPTRACGGRAKAQTLHRRRQGTVHGITYDLATQFGLGLGRIAETG